MTVGKRLFLVAVHFKKTILLALLMLSIAVAAELTGPFVAKKMIDTHIMGIELPWYETSEQPYAVSYQGKWYTREDHLSETDQRGKEVRILQVGRFYVFVDRPVPLDGERVLGDAELTIVKGNERAVYPAQKLSSQEVFAFFRPETMGLLVLAALYGGLLVIASVFHYGQKFLLQKSANLVIKKLRVDVFAHVQRLPVTYFDHLPAGKIVARVTNDTEAIREMFANVLASFFTSGIYLIGIFIALFLLDVRLALVSLIILPIMLVWILFYRRFATRFNHVIRTRISDINGMINESIQGMPIIQAFRRQKETLREFDELNDDLFAYQNKMLRLNATVSFNMVMLLRNVAFILFIWYFGGASLGVGTLFSLGVLYAFVDYLNRLFQPITQIMNQLANFEQARVAAHRLFELMDEPGIDVEKGSIGRYQGKVSFQNVSFAYLQDQYVLKNISFEASPGETVALVGHTGSGKSSIINLLFRFYEINRGEIQIDGQNILQLPKQFVRQHMAIVLQDPFLFTGTIASNVSLNDPSISRERVEKALQDVGADLLLRTLPKGLDEPVIEKGSTLSAGQRQLISFARALAFDPAILVLDEATASIDTETEGIIQQALEVLKKGRTTFMIAHRLSTIKNADQILVLDRGEIVERGRHDDLMELCGKYYHMYQLQQGSSAVAPAG
ncbi:ABC transporter ATP-binding protein [Brevibacillus invocatus]|uniref:ABC transporter ATP-binding protein n=1 Tax=Brevibacillus invocatus TaxID=173959 RepID=A0A3M8CF52_9BACL|nr:ABC transporter ATP-binding protein [Brevibacillus invocatus]MCM3080362.1 ABC transporter ATP-binding protein/permease [Brevibacillus invocatus]MCM3430557.1 ABC transporter ATP-binding protein/permease [Brevibacillus invocatus]RNB74384.1 ABC transporter ATP-binding protein [Brevibacillus invocatus]